MQWTKTVEVVHLPMGTSSQKAKLISLTRELQIAKSQQDNIYTDSKYAFIIAHTHSVLWKERGFLTTKGTPIIDKLLIVKLLEALQLHAEVAIIHCQGHQSYKDPLALGNARVDLIAQGLALSSTGTTEHILFLIPSYQSC